MDFSCFAFDFLILKILHAAKQFYFQNIVSHECSIRKRGSGMLM